MGLIFVLTFLTLLLPSLIRIDANTGPNGLCPVVLGHRGAAGIYPEHTVIAYENGADLGADYIECDVQITKDLHLVCSHEAWIKEVCNVEKRPEFANRSNTYNMDDDDPDFDWNDKGDIGPNFFTIDFNVDELKTLLRRQVTPSRNPNFDDKYSFVSFDEYVSIAKSKGVGIAPEIKSPTAINKILAERGKNVTVEDLVLAALSKHGYSGPDDKCLLQSFELSSIERLKGRTGVKRVFLLKRAAKTNQENLQRVKNADVFSICLDKTLILPPDSKGNCGVPNQALVEQIHALGMQVYAYTFKNELTSLCWNYLGDVQNELDKFYDLGLDGYFADYPNTVRSFFDQQNCTRESMDSNGAASIGFGFWGMGRIPPLTTQFSLSHWIMLVFATATAIPLLIGLLV